MDADVALRNDFDSESDEGPLLLSRRASPSNHQTATQRQSRLALNNGVGWIEVLRPIEESLENHDEGTSVRFHQDELAPARGIVFGIVFGASLWAMLGGLLSILFF